MKGEGARGGGGCYLQRRSGYITTVQLLLPHPILQPVSASQIKNRDFSTDSLGFSSGLNSATIRWKMTEALMFWTELRVWTTGLAGGGTLTLTQLGTLTGRGGAAALWKPHQKVVSTISINL